jgi:DNA mismatch repair protein MutL
MSRIRLLPEALVNKIAAGEVVERPASVVKELIENALDAGATTIRVVVRGGGRREIRVEDDGCGMERDDLLLAFERHSTSKLKDFPDLEDLSTLGFRGEALPSIAGVSDIRITSRPVDTLSATRIHISGGTIREVAEVGAPAGTVVEVRRLFFNTPARLKFLKTPRTEMGHITAEVIAHALAYPGVAFRFERDREVVFDLPAASTLRERLGDIWGNDPAGGMVPIEEAGGGCMVRGFIVHPDQVRTIRKGLSLFVNRRPVRDRIVFSAVLEGYGPRLSGRRYPAGVILIDLAGRGVDVNIHPAKREVRFANPEFIRRLVVRAVGNALKSEESARSFYGGGDRFPVQGVGEAGPSAFNDMAQQEMVLPLPVTAERSPEGEAATSSGYRILGQAGNRYLLVQAPEGVIIIDQHAAHERVIYERFLGGFKKEKIELQPLLAPINLDLDPPRSARLREQIPLLREMGIDIEPFGSDSFIITALPAIITGWRREELVLDMLAELEEPGRRPGDPREEIIIRMACLAAVKARERLAPIEMSRLVEELFACEDPAHCPHGRPTMLTYRWDDLERRFGRR